MPLPKSPMPPPARPPAGYLATLLQRKGGAVFANHAGSVSRVVRPGADPVPREAGAVRAEAAQIAADIPSSALPACVKERVLASEAAVLSPQQEPGATALLGPRMGIAHGDTMALRRLPRGLVDETSGAAGQRAPRPAAAVGMSQEVQPLDASRRRSALGLQAESGFGGTPAAQPLVEQSHPRPQAILETTIPWPAALNALQRASVRRQVEQEGRRRLADSGREGARNAAQKVEIRVDQLNLRVEAPPQQVSAAPSARGSGSVFPSFFLSASLR